MRLGRYRNDDGASTWPGVRADADDDAVVNLREAGAAAGIACPERTSDLLGTWRWRERVAMLLAYAEDTGVGRHALAALERGPPVAEPGKIVCVGLNYRDHAEEGDNPIPDEPVLFAKFPTAIIGPGEPITWDPALSGKVDYEAELVVVIGAEAKDRSPAEAMDAVAGYTVGNDVSARDLQHGDGQWVRGKSLDTFAPIGPEMVDREALGDPHDLDIWTTVNGERLQDSTTANLIFGVADLVSFCSRAFTLRPGDLLFTGTPPGVGVYRDPPVLLEEGDTVTVGVEAIGTLTNGCAYRERSS